MSIKRETVLLLVNVLVLTAVIAGSIALVLPTIGRNIDDPNKIAYFNHDEGYIMDLIWYYYSGEKRDSFQYDRDYGLMYRYLADLAHIVPSRIIVFTPGTFVYILRWLNLISWVLAVIALWYIVRYHFGTLWQPLAAALLLATSQAFSVLSVSSKPEPVVLLFMIMGIHYALRLIERGSRRYFFLAVGCATIAFLIKYAGVFLLPAIAVALYLASRYRGAEGWVFRRIKIAWIFPALAGLLFMALSFSTIFLYRRRITGLTWYQEFGFRKALMQNSMIIYIVLGGVSLVFLSVGLWYIGKKDRGNGISNFVNEVVSCVFITSGVCALFSAVMGFRWIINPGLFIDLCAQTGREAIAQAPIIGSSTTSLFLSNMAYKIQSFNPSIFILLMTYCVLELLLQSARQERDRIMLYKRIVLLVFILSFFPYMFSMAYVGRHSMLPFYAVGVILGLQAIGMVLPLLVGKRLVRATIIALCAILVSLMVVKNTAANLNAFTYRYGEGQDVAFDAALWMMKHYAPDTSILADHPTRVYLPSGFKNVKFLKFQLDAVEQIKDLVGAFKPRIVYINMGVPKGYAIPPVDGILSDKKTKLIASFSSKYKHYQRYPEGRYEIYEITY